ncbi:phosphoenolpyruvate-protein phosphotransferase PtsI [Paludibacterium yongneupense]|uniref:phosphoenolpyruvate-protein phosphotransferase PtsI n=1 Tax=Paludibacterium yongneupense TaxID=400061 RepID=UPI0004171B31|nr:phosphoenolpyruvate-protein phosphotransferase PtsI [Paludibacterium yongneupense]
MTYIEPLSGIPCSPGVSIARALVIGDDDIVINPTPIEDGAVEEEIARFHAARDAALSQVRAISDHLALSGKVEQQAIFEGHLVLLEDEELEHDVLALIRQSHYRSEQAIHEAIESYAKMVSDLDDPYLRERATDCRDIGARLIRNVLGVQTFDLGSIAEDTILVARDFTPSQTAQISLEHVKGLISELGGRTSHSAIMARSLELPAIVGVKNATLHIRSGDLIALDVEHNQIWVRPDAARLADIRAVQRQYALQREKWQALRDLPALTRDGHRVELCANIGTVRDADSAQANGAEGIGLYRTEFLFMDRPTLPGEEEQYLEYSAIARAMSGKAVIVRTMDIGGDKELPCLDFPKELNPFLGWRAIRIFFDRPDIMLPQLRAILRASAHGPLRIMFPMVAAVEEFRALKAQVCALKDELRADGVPFDEAIPLGVMIETPAAAVLARFLAREVDFFSIGTNDLTQYTLAVDRGNEQIARMYQPLSPAVLGLIQQVIDASHAAGKWTGMCGELAGDERATALLVGMGLDEFSMSAIALPRIKAIVRSLDYEAARQLAVQVRECATLEEVEDRLQAFARQNSGASEAYE